jgi:SpoVK/Ycf46/Vps4 family AAA+-type ATPase
MPKLKELTALFRAIGANDHARAISAAKKIAADHGSQGKFKAERELLTALSESPTRGARQAPPSDTTWSVASSLMQLDSKNRLSALQMPHALREDFEDLIKEWKGRVVLQKRRIPRRWRLLFHGPPGCGKSAAAAALASEIGLPGYLVRFDSLIGAYLGQTALRLRELFQFAKHTPCILLFDEVDALAKKRGSPMDVGELDRIVIAFMQELEHAAGEGYVIATSNIPHALDEALWRRFDMKVKFPKPTRTDLKRFASSLSKAVSVKLKPTDLADILDAPSYAEAERLVVGIARREILKTTH